MRPLIYLLCIPAAVAAVNYDDDVRPILARRCFACHSASEMRSGLNLETYAGIMKGGSSGDAIKPGRPSTSLLYLAVAHEGDGVPRMPLGQPKIPDAEIGVIRDWIQAGALENANSKSKGPVVQSLEFRPLTLNKPSGPPPMPAGLPGVNAVPEQRANPVTALAASPWAPLLAVARHDRIELWDSGNRTLLGALPFPEGIPYVLRFSRDGATLLAGGGRGVQTGKVVLFDVRTGKRLASVGQEADIVLAADISADGKRVALGGPGKAVKVFSVPDGKELYQIKRHTDWITSLEFSPDGTKLATGDRAGGIHLWEAATGGIIVSLSEHKDSVTSLSWRPDGRVLASSGEDGQLIVWDAVDGFPVANNNKAHTPKQGPGEYGKPHAGVLSAQFLADGRLVSVGRDRTVKMWTPEGKPRGASAPLEALPTKVTGTFNGAFVVAGDFQGRLVFWDGKKTDYLLAAATNRQ